MQDKERHMMETISRLEVAKESSLPPTDLSDIASQHYELLDAKLLLLKNSSELEKSNQKITKSKHDFEASSSRVSDLESKLEQLQVEYEQLLEQSIKDQDQLIGHDEFSAAINDVRDRLERQFHSKKEAFELDMNTMQSSIKEKDGEIGDLRQQLQFQMESRVELERKLQTVNQSSQEGLQITHMRQVMVKQLAEFEEMRKKLAHDLQSRNVDGNGEVIVEHALSHLAEAASEESPASLQKVQFLQKAMDQLTIVQRQLVQQNSQLKKDVFVMEKKLSARIDRIGGLESLLRQSQNALDDQEIKYILILLIL